MMTDAVLRDYLLGRTPDEEVDALETRILADEELFYRARSAENDLFDAFARQDLDAETRAAFLKRYGTGNRRARFARALADRVPAANVVAFPRRRWIGFAAAAAVAITIGSIYLLRSPGGQPQMQTQVVHTIKPPSIISTVVVTLATTRDGETRTDVTLPRDATALRVRVRLDPEDKFDRYRLTFLSSTGAQVWRSENLSARAENGDLILAADVPAALAAGTYRVTVEAGGSTLGFATVEVHR